MEDGALLEEVLLQKQLDFSKDHSMKGHTEAQLEEIAEHEGRQCLLRFLDTPYPAGSPHCNATWDTLFCWPTTPANQVASIPCEDIIGGLNPSPQIMDARAYRVCDADGEWLWGNWTNYTECTQLLDHMTQHHQPTGREVTVTVISYIGLVGSIASLVSLSVALFIFCYFKSLQCSRLSVHKNLVVSFIIRFVLMIIVTEPSVTGRKDTFMHTEWLCKLILALKMYSMMSNVNWMFVEGFYLHSRITVSVFNTEAPFLLFYTIGWGVPLINVLIWSAVLERHMTSFCWLGYSTTSYIWIVAAPMSLALLVNLIFLINIVRILVTKLRANTSVETHQIMGTQEPETSAAIWRNIFLSVLKLLCMVYEYAQRLRLRGEPKSEKLKPEKMKAIKATAVLFPLLGTTNLLFFVNPKDGGKFENAYIIVNAFLQSAQGIFVSILYCFLNSEVHSAVRKRYVRLMLQRKPTSRKFARRKFSRSSSFFLSQYEICSPVNQNNCKMDAIVETS